MSLPATAIPRAPSAGFILCLIPTLLCAGCAETLSREIAFASSEGRPISPVPVIPADECGDRAFTAGVQLARAERFQGEWALDDSIGLPQAYALRRLGAGAAVLGQVAGPLAVGVEIGNGGAEPFIGLTAHPRSWAWLLHLGGGLRVRKDRVMTRTTIRELVDPLHSNEYDTTRILEDEASRLHWTFHLGYAALATRFRLFQPFASIRAQFESVGPSDDWFAGDANPEPLRIAQYQLDAGARIGFGPRFHLLAGGGPLFIDGGAVGMTWRSFAAFQFEWPPASRRNHF